MMASRRSRERVGISGVMIRASALLGGPTWRLRRRPPIAGDNGEGDNGQEDGNEREPAGATA
jgi:hypothetical protein